ncbi:hypothetical protein FGO68_gene7587 [Halteria grandinella]|uniref:Polyadenylate-binding protein, cytoplasmic and nuclear n=1 Tax=Halteria grandinella TaxID=5974 RepID=A0A8J8P5I6_HALGN|nr:hypothetical protein FGO68_gene7587 [Halteria grandinella]
MESQQQSQTTSSTPSIPVQQQPLTGLTLVLRLQGLPTTATNEKLAAVLEEKKVATRGCQVEINPVSKTCENGFGSVSFANRADLAFGVKELKNSSIDGSQIAIRPTGSTDFNTATSIFLRNIPDGTTLNDLYPGLSQFGTVIASYLPMDPVLKKPKGIAYIDYDLAESAQQAIAKLNGTPGPKGNGSIGVSAYQTATSKHVVGQGATRQSAFASSKSNIFVKNLPFSVQEQQVRELFSRYGTIKSMRLKKPELSRNPAITIAYAIAYLEFDKEEEALNAIKELNGFAFLGHNLIVETFNKGKQEHINLSVADVVGQQVVKGLFITGLRKDVTEERLKEIFAKFGTVQSLKLKTKEFIPGVPSSTGKAQVFYFNKDDAGQAMQKLYYERELGDNIDVSYYKQKEALIYEQDRAMNDPLSQLLAKSRPFFQAGRPNYNHNDHNQYQASFQARQEGGAGAAQQPGAQGTPYGQQNSTHYQQRHNNQHGSQYPRGGGAHHQHHQNVNSQQPRPNTQSHQNQPTQDHQPGGQYRTKSQKLPGAPADAAANTSHQTHHHSNRQNQNQRGGNQHYQNKTQPRQTAPVPPPNPQAMVFTPQPVAYYMPQQQQPIFAPVAPQIIFNPLVALDVSILQKATNEGDAKQYIGEQIYPFIEAVYPDDASKLTGMILESRSIEDLKQYCANKDVFYGILTQAYQVLLNARQAEAAAAKNASG